uniref:Aminotransferase-like plant mobile domain-containing protein n=1 Tax=Cannabis sativa TaxID=3483 RepID=A0A803QE03_CANSA
MCPTTTAMEWYKPYTKEFLNVHSLVLKAYTYTPHEIGSFSTRFSLPSFLKQVKRLTDHQSEALQKTGFGNLLSIPNQRLNKSLLDELMRRWDTNKQAFVLPRGEISLNLMDIALILSLRVVGPPVSLVNSIPFGDLERDYGAVIWKRKITVTSLESKLNSFGDLCSDEFVITFLMYTFGTFLFPNANGTVDSRLLSYIQDVDSIRRFSWGEAVLKDVCNWLDQRKMKSVKYVGGCLLFLQIWSFEHIDIARPALLGSSVSFPRVFKWDKSKLHSKQQIMSQFKSLHNDQVTQELQLTSWESEIDIIKELLEAQSNEKEHSEVENSCVNSPIVIDCESEVDTIKELLEAHSNGKEHSEAENSCVNSPIVIDCDFGATPQMMSPIIIEVKSVSKIIHKKPKLIRSASQNDANTIITIGEEEDLRRRVKMLEEKIMELQKENVELMGENEELRKDNKLLRLSSDNLVFRLEKLLLDEDHC